MVGTTFYGNTICIRYNTGLENMVEKYLMSTQSDWDSIVVFVLGIVVIWIFSYIRSRK